MLVYHGTFLRFDEGSAPKKKMKWASGVDPVRWEAAEERALLMLEQCKDLSPQQKIAKLRKNHDETCQRARMIPLNALHLSGGNKERTRHGAR